jgi:hypothetical protein
MFLTKELSLVLTGQLVGQELSNKKDIICFS